MIKAVLLDLDDTLITTDTDVFTAEYLNQLGAYTASLSPKSNMASEIMQSYGTALSMYAPEQTLVERFASVLSQRIEADPNVILDVTERYYIEQYDDLVAQFIASRPVVQNLLTELASRALTIVIATNPGLPRIAIDKRMRGGGLNPNDDRINSITSIETMAFGKPQPEYYLEIIQRLGIEPWEAIMVGDDIVNDIAPAESVGLHTYLVLPEPEAEASARSTTGPCGSLEFFCELVQQEWLQSLEGTETSHDQFIRQLAVFPATVSTMIRSHTAEVLECRPSEDSWSARDIVCHLRDHEVEEDRFRLERILSEDNPFLSGNYNPHARVSEYTSTSIHDAFDQFLDRRISLVKWLREVSADAWERSARHAVFGPTSFAEMVRFTVEHDRTHLQQMHGAIINGLQVCGLD